MVQASLADLLAQGAVQVHVKTSSPSELQRALEVRGYLARDVSVGRLLVTGATPEQVGGVAAESGYVIEELLGTSGSLEDVFLQLTESGSQR